MTCAEFEILLADYIDDTLGSSERAALEHHAASCAGCQEFFEDAKGAAALLRRADEVAVPPDLVTRIAFQAPRGRTREPLERPGLLTRLTGRWLQPILQPRLVMGMAMTILSFAMLERCTGLRVQHIQPADLNPVRIWGNVEDKALRTKDRVVKYYENLRWVYEIETRLKALQEQQDQTAPGKNSADQKNRQQGKKR